jgi:chromosome segregation ATPase
MQRNMIRMAVIVVLLLGGAAARGRTQGVATSQDVLPALLAEVRGLRAAIEQMASAGPRVQLALGRLQLQEQRINTLIRRLETVRASLTTAQREQTAHEDGLKGLEAALKEAHPEREALEAQAMQMKRGAARAAAEVQRLLGEEAAVTAEITT